MDDQVGEGSPVERSLLLKSFDTIPSPEKFSSEIERFNVPAVSKSCHSINRFCKIVTVAGLRLLPIGVPWRR